MKKKCISSLMIGLLLVGLLVNLCGCGATEDMGETIVNPIKITISIDFPAKSKVKDIKNVSFKIEEGSTVLDAVQLYCNVNNIEMNVETTNSDIIGIGGVDNGDYVKAYTWQYTINEKKQSTPASQLDLKDGDVLTMIYTKPSNE